MYYHFSIILAFYPLLSLRFLGSKISAVEVCTDAANAIVSLVRTYERLYGLRRIPCFLPYIILASGITRIGTASSEISPIGSLTEYTQEMAFLQLMSRHHGSSKNAFRFLLSRTPSPSWTGGEHDKDLKEDVYSTWDPFLTTMIWLSSGRGVNTSLLEASTQLSVSDHAITYEDQLRRNGFESMI
jgi:hypothetical protein